MGYLRADMAQPGLQVEGLIVARGMDEGLQYSAAAVPGLQLMTYEVSIKLSTAGGSPARSSFRPLLNINETRVSSVPVACQYQSRRIRHPHAAERLDLRLWRNSRDDAQAAPIG